MLNTVYWFFTRFSFGWEGFSSLPSIPVSSEGFVQVLYFIISTSVNKNSQHFLQVIYLILVVNSLEIGKRCIVEPSTAMCPGYCDNENYSYHHENSAKYYSQPEWESVSRWCCNTWASPWHLYWDKSLLLANTISCWPYTDITRTLTDQLTTAHKYCRNGTFQIQEVSKANTDCIIIILRWTHKYLSGEIFLTKKSFQSVLFWVIISFTKGPLRHHRSFVSIK